MIEQCGVKDIISVFPFQVFTSTTLLLRSEILVSGIHSEKPEENRNVVDFFSGSRALKQHKSKEGKKWWWEANQVILLSFKVIKYLLWFCLYITPINLNIALIFRVESSEMKNP